MKDFAWLDEIENNGLLAACELQQLIETVKVMREALLLVEKTYDDDCKDQIVKKCLEKCK